MLASPMVLRQDEGLARLYDDYRPTLQRLLIARLGAASEAEDVLQDLWIKVQQQPPVEVRHAKAYLFRMAQNLAIDRLRVRQRRMTRDRRWSDEATYFAPATYEQVDQAPTAEQILLEREEVAVLASAIANLPDGARRAFELHKIEGLSHAHVAENMGITRSGVEKHIAVAMKHLKRALMD